MKFFSNDAKENSDEPYNRDHGDVVTSDPVAVPQQRAGSPWSDAPAESRPADTRTDEEAGSPDDELAQQESRDRTDEEAAGRRDDLEEPDGRHREVGEPDGTATVTTYHPDGTVETEDRADSPVRDEGTFDSPQAVEPATGEPLAATDKSDLSDSSGEPESDPALRRDVADEPVEEQAVKDEGTFDSSQAVEPATGEPLATPADETDEPESDPALRRDVAEAPDVTTPATPGSVPAPALDRLFSDGDSFAERFRDIQLRFVDSPKEATADAAALVGEAVDKLTGALKAQKDALGGESDDTEQLRVQLRSYRDLLNRLSAL